MDGGNKPLAQRPVGVPVVVGLTSAMHAAIVAASLAVPVLAPLLAGETGVPAAYVGYYASIVYGTAMLSTVFTVGVVRRFGAARTMQLSLLLASIGLGCVYGGTLQTMALSGFCIGIAYGPINPTGSHLLARHTPAARRSLIFSAKQMSVPLGGAAAGFVLPRIAAAHGWRETATGFALTALLLAFCIAPWRNRLDDDRQPAAAVRALGAFAPLRMVVAAAPLRDLAIAAGLLSGVQFCVGAYFVTALVGSAGRTLAEGGSMLSVMLVSSILARIPWGIFADRIGPRRVLALLSLLIALTAGSLALLGTAWPFAGIVALSIAIGATAFSWSGILMAEVARLAAGAGVVDATAGVMFFAYLGAFVIPALVAAIAALVGSIDAGFVLFSIVALPLGLRLLAGPPLSLRN